MDIRNRWNRPVLVAVNGTLSGRVAARVAAAEALLRQRELHLFAAHPPAGGTAPLINARRAMIDALIWLRATHPGLDVDARVLPGDPAALLVERSATADLVVVATVPVGLARGPLPVPGERVATHAVCPTLVAHHAAVPGGDVIVALDGGLVDGGALDGGVAPDALLDYAFDAAAVRGAALRPVLGWTATAETTRGDADRLLAEALAGWSDKYPDVPVRRQEICAPDVARALVGLSAWAALVVAPAGTVLGAVARRLVLRAHCPVALVPLRAG